MIRWAVMVDDNGKDHYKVEQPQINKITEAHIKAYGKAMEKPNTWWSWTE